MNDFDSVNIISMAERKKKSMQIEAPTKEQSAVLIHALNQSVRKISERTGRMLETAREMEAIARNRLAKTAHNG
jgi:hypothetical protein